MHKVHEFGRIAIIRQEHFGPKFERGKEFEISLLITLVGSILIYGLGKTVFQKNL